MLLFDRSILLIRFVMIVGNSYRLLLFAYIYLSLGHFISYILFNLL